MSGRIRSKCLPTQHPERKTAYGWRMLSLSWRSDIRSHLPSHTPQTERGQRPSRGVETERLQHELKAHNVTASTSTTNMQSEVLTFTARFL